MPSNQKMWFESDVPAVQRFAHLRVRPRYMSILRCSSEGENSDSNAGVLLKRLVSGGPRGKASSTHATWLGRRAVEVGLLPWFFRKELRLHADPRGDELHAEGGGASCANAQIWMVLDKAPHPLILLHPPAQCHEQQAQEVDRQDKPQDVTKASEWQNTGSGL